MNFFFSSFMVVLGVIAAIGVCTFTLRMLLAGLGGATKALARKQQEENDKFVHEYLVQKKADYRAKATALIDEAPEVAEVVDLLSRTPHDASPRERARLTARMRKLVSNRRVRDELYEISYGS